MLVIIYPVTRYARYQEKASILSYLVITLFIIYLSNHEQYSITLMLGLASYIFYCFIQNKKEQSVYYRESIKVALYPFAATILASILMFFVPGHLARMSSTAEQELWLSQYSDWSLATKIYRGYTSTVANLFFQRQNHIIIFCLVLAVMAALNLRSRGIIPRLWYK